MSQKYVQKSKFVSVVAMSNGMCAKFYVMMSVWCPHCIRRAVTITESTCRIS